MRDYQIDKLRNDLLLENIPIETALLRHSVEGVAILFFTLGILFGCALVLLRTRAVINSNSMALVYLLVPEILSSHGSEMTYQHLSSHIRLTGVRIGDSSLASTLNTLEHKRVITARKDYERLDKSGLAPRPTIWYSLPSDSDRFKLRPC